jgi:hypothetical protein
MKMKHSIITLAEDVECVNDSSVHLNS